MQVDSRGGSGQLFLLTVGGETCVKRLVWYGMRGAYRSGGFSWVTFWRVFLVAVAQNVGDA